MGYLDPVVSTARQHPNAYSVALDGVAYTHDQSEIYRAHDDATSCAPQRGRNSRANAVKLVIRTTRLDDDDLRWRYGNHRCLDARRC